MAKVTYLFGAGASANALPIVSQIPARLEDFFHFIVGNRIGSTEVIIDDFTIRQMEDDFLHELEDIRSQVALHQSIDTYAKKLRITAAKDSKKELKYFKLKSIMSCFFIYEQLRRPADNRYDAFFASILGDSDLSLPENVRIISWNYDFQFEKSYSLYSMKDSLRDNQLALTIYPGPLPLDRWKDGFSIFKLNGTTAFYDRTYDNNGHLHDYFELQDKGDLVKQFVKHYTLSLPNASKRLLPLLSFTWEKDWSEATRMRIEKATESVHDSEVLVIIGYSVPFFNREVDRTVLSSLTHSVKSIYIQDKSPDAVREKLPSIWGKQMLPKDIILMEKTDQFFLPPEL